MPGKSRRTYQPVHKLVALYWETESQEVAAGILNELARRSEAATRNARLLFLLEAAQEHDARETCKALRDSARSMIARHMLPMSSGALVGDETMRLVQFFAQEPHADLLGFSERDRLIAWVDFLGGCIIAESCDFPVDLRTFTQLVRRSGGSTWGPWSSRMFSLTS